MTMEEIGIDRITTATISIKFSRESPMFVLQCVAVCCSVLQCVDCHNFHHVFTGVPDLCVAVCCSVLQCVAVCCSVLQCVAVC